MNRTTHRRLVTALAGGLAGGLLLAGGTGSEAAVRGSIHVGPPEASFGTTAATRSIRFSLYTHCGIDEALVGATFFEAETPLPGPPAGWDNPTQRGTMTLLPKAAGQPERARFSDDRGHRVQFRERMGATGFKRICR